MHMHIAKAGKNKIFFIIGKRIGERGQNTLGSKVKTILRFGSDEFVFSQCGHNIPL